MSRKHPIISITGSSGAGTTSVKRTFEQIFFREKVNAAYIEGDAFHRYDRAEMRQQMALREDVSDLTKQVRELEIQVAKLSDRLERK